ncbi:Rpn family recombination-promoting nuclease/putative transposase [Clostridium carnis]
MKIDINDNSFLMKPKNDYVFKRIFGDEKNKDILIAFLQSVLKIDIKDIKILNSELPKENIQDKKSILDIRATIDNNIEIDIEIQVARTIYMPQRSLYYWSKIYAEQLEAGAKYSKLKKTVCINILDFDTLDTKKYHSIFKIKEEEENYILTDLLEIHFLEMKKLKGYNENDDLSQWINFIKADSKEVLESMAKVNPNIDKAVHVLTTMSQDKKTRAEYLSREMALHDEATRIEEAIEEGYEKGMEKGIEKGIEQGIEKANIENAKNFLRLGIEIDIIVKATGLSKEKVSKLYEEIIIENNNK